MSDTMRGVVFHTTGDASVFQVENVAVPSPKEGEVLLELDFAGVNFVDIYLRSGLYPINLPAIAGREGAGKIVKLGPNVPASFDLHVGDKIAVFVQGTLAEYVCAPADKVLKLPARVSTKIGSAVMLQGLTAWTLVRDAHRVEKGQIVLVQAAAGGTGSLLIQMCKYLGATVIGTVSTIQKAKVAKDIGCDHVIIYTEIDVIPEVMRLTEDKGCHAVFSGVGQSTFAVDLASVRRKGTLVTFGNSSGPVENFRVLDLSKKNVKLVRPTLANYIAQREEFEVVGREMLDLVVKGKLKVEFGGEYTLESVGQAQDDLASKKTTGKLLVKIKV
ncbi:hypothetical protein G7Z17_g600 [Cylindrodendrum hubeiense]|uniref:Probable quinone oxidoreductase n=1 Tax=Cylindrodendrum hubeiense TaxID=595255 RepID=A0A9P5LD88_9HYPO|nr:hypothetical protein G7Z17_g600 [Cylindrodendrum hubeiense]